MTIPSDRSARDDTAEAADPFGTAALRSAVLAAWAASPARFREDANAEESLTIGYADRVVAELAANAADAAHAGGVTGTLWIRIVDGELRAANTGAPLTADGVAALASLRASAKRSQAPGHAQAGPDASDPIANQPGNAADPDRARSVGHFGVGFTAVRALTDTPSVVSTTGGIRFSAADTLAAAAALGVPGLDAEIAARSGQMPALRLPWPVPASAESPPDGFDSEVRLPLRKDVDAGELADALTAPACLDLLWALPDLQSVRLGAHQAVRRDATEPVGSAGSSEPPIDVAPGSRIEPFPEPLTVEIDGVAGRFRAVNAAGRIPDDLLVDRPVEERGRTAWRLTWVLPLDDDVRPNPLVRTMIGAPTPTDEPLTLPALLVGTFPVDDTRRHLARGPLADHLIERAVDAYLDLVLTCPPDQRIALIPAPGFPAGPFDARLRDAVLGALPRLPFLIGANGHPLRPADARVLPGLTDPAAGLFADVVPGLLPWPSSGSAAGIAARLRSVGAAALAVGDVSAALAGLERPVDFWLDVYDALAQVMDESGVDAEELADLPVPREGGGTIIGPRGVLVHDPGGSPLGAGASPLEPTIAHLASLPARAAELIPGLRIAADGVAHPLLHRLGALPADAAAFLADPLTASEIRRRREDLDEFDPDPDDVTAFGDLVADLVAAAGGAPAFASASGSPGPIPLAGVLLTDVDGEVWPAGELLLPDAPLARVLIAEADLPTVGRRWIDRHGVRVLEALGVRAGFSVVSVPVPPDPHLEIDGLAAWWDEVGAHAGPIDSVPVITDLDLVEEASWPAALTMIVSNRRTRDAMHPIGSGASYGAWWIGLHARFDGGAPGAWRTADADDLVGLFEVFPVELPGGVAAEIGVLADLHTAISRSPATLVARWADPARRPLPADVPALTAAVVGILAADPDLDLPDTVRTVDGGVIEADRAIVLDQPWLAAALPASMVVAGGEDAVRVAAALDIDLGSDVIRAEVVAESVRQTRLDEVPAARYCLDFFGLADLAAAPVTVAEGLAVDAAVRDEPPRRLRVGWWVPDGRVLTDASPAGVGRVIAHLADRWVDRHAFAAIATGDDLERVEAAMTTPADQR